MKVHTLHRPTRLQTNQQICTYVQGNRASVSSMEKKKKRQYSSGDIIANKFQNKNPHSSILYVRTCSTLFESTENFCFLRSHTRTHVHTRHLINTRLVAMHKFNQHRACSAVANRQTRHIHVININKTTLPIMTFMQISKYTDAQVNNFM